MDARDDRFRRGTIRAARPEDAPAIGIVHVGSWQAAYRGHFPQEFLDALDPARRAEGWRAYLEGGMGRNESLLVCEIKDQIVGFAYTGPCRDGQGGGELRAIYLLPQDWGHGHGHELAASALEELALQGFTEAMLWVLEENLRARAFYEAGGWRRDGGSRVIEPFGFPIPELRYRISLDMPRP